MQILAVGDTHGNEGFVRWAVQYAKDRNIEHILQLGDFGFWTHRPRGKRFLNVVSNALLSAGCTMTVVRGNHDNTSKILEDHGSDRDPEGFVRVRPGLRLAPDGLVWTWGKKKFISLGGAYSPDKAHRLEFEAATGEHGEHWFPDEQMTEKEMYHAVLRAGAYGGVDIIAAHDRPASARLDKPPLKDPGLVPNPERLALAIQELRPALFLHGHMHYRYEDKVPHKYGYANIIGLASDPETSESPNVEDSVLVVDLDF